MGAPGQGGGPCPAVPAAACRGVHLPLGFEGLVQADPEGPLGLAPPRHRIPVVCSSVGETSGA